MNTQKICSFIVLSVLFYQNAHGSNRELECVTNDFCAISDVNARTAGFIEFVKAIESQNNDLKKESALMQLKKQRKSLGVSYALANKPWVRFCHGLEDTDPQLVVQNVENLGRALDQYDKLLLSTECAKDIREGNCCTGRAKVAWRLWFGCCMKSNLKKKEE